MLTRELAIAEFDFARSRILPDRLTRKTHQPYLAYAERALNIYRHGTGRTRRDLHRAVRDVFAAEADCPARRIDAFCKLLDDVSAYHRDPRGKAAELRRKVFRMSAARHPLVTKADRLFETEEAKVKADIAAHFGRSWDDIEGDLFADVIEFHRLAKFDGFPDAQSLLARYNVAQVQAALFDAVSMTVWAAEDFKTILRYAKLARLMHSIARTGEGQYRLRFDGPASVLRETRRYGAAMARFLPALIACRNWRMHAVIRTRRSGWSAGLDLSSQDGLTSHLPAPDDFDSSVEQAFAEKWGQEEREGWQLIREGEILHRGQKVFVPDFLFRHTDGRTVLLEIIGFWTPEYLQAKLETLRTFADQHILLAVAESATTSLPELSQDAIIFKTTLRIKDVLSRLNATGG
jgi:predicted nuclease of restriction endonuclease-like RecB superfamily